MKRLVLILSALALVVMLLPVPTPAQDTVINVYRNAPPPQSTLVFGTPYEPRYAAPPVPVRYGPPVYAGGCQGRSAGYMLVPVAAGGCQGRAAVYGAGCFGSGMAYGAPRGDGTFATPSGRPEPPGVLPWNGPIVGTIRAASGYDRYYRP